MFIKSVNSFIFLYMCDIFKAIKIFEGRAEYCKMQLPGPHTQPSRLSQLRVQGLETRRKMKYRHHTSGPRGDQLYSRKNVPDLSLTDRQLVDWRPSLFSETDNL